MDIIYPKAVREGGVGRGRPRGARGRCGRCRGAMLSYARPRFPAAVLSPCACERGYYPYTLLLPLPLVWALLLVKKESNPFIPPFPPLPPSSLPQIGPLKAMLKEGLQNRKVTALFGPKDYIATYSTCYAM